MVVVVDKVEPWDDVRPDARVSALPVRGALHVLSHGRVTVEGLALLDLVRHLTHVHFDFATVLPEAVETVCDKGL